MLDNKIPGDLNLVGNNPQFRESGNENITDSQQSSLFFNTFEGSSLSYGFYCDFTSKYKYDINLLYSDLLLDSAGTEGPVSDNLVFEFLPRSFATVEDGEIFAGTKVPIISEILPYVDALDSNGLPTFAYNINIIPNYTGASATGWQVPDSPYGFVNTLDLSANTYTSGLVSYTIQIKAISDIVRVKNFGFIYNMSVENYVSP